MNYLTTLFVNGRAKLNAHLGILTLVLLSLTLAACAVDAATPKTPEEWKVYLNTVPMMFVALIMGTLAYGLIQQRTASNNGKPMGFLEYWSYGREAIIALILNVAGFVFLLMADQLTLTGAFTLGLTGSALADLPKGGRTEDLAKAPEARG